MNPCHVLRPAVMRMLASLLVRLEKLDGSGYFAFFIHQIF